MVNLEEIKEKFPFLTGLRHQNQEYIGIVQNSDDKIISFYDYECIKTIEEKKFFLELGDTWWWQSNRELSPNIFLQGQMKPFRYCMKTIINKEVEVMFGPMTSLSNIMKKRIKKRQIQLIRKID